MSPKTWAKSLFVRPTARPIRRPTTRTTLGLEALGDRVMPSVTSAVAAGVLTITSDNAADTVEVSTSPTSTEVTIAGVTKVTQINLWGAPLVFKTYANQGDGVFAGVRSIKFAGNGGDDNFTYFGALPVTADGGAGNDMLVAGSGNDTFLGSPGNDVFVGGSGANVLDRRGNHGYFLDGSTDDTTYDSVSNSTKDRLGAGELQAAGQLNVRLSNDSQRLWFTGPSGAGFALKANWTADITSSTTYDRGTSGSSGPVVQYYYAYTAAGDVTLEGAWGDVKLPTSGAAFQVKADGTPAYGVGRTPRFYLGGVGLDSGALSQQVFGKFGANLGGSVASQVKSQSGATATVPALAWGLSLGGGVGDADAPLNPAVPYLFGHARTGYSMGYDNVSYTSDGSKEATFAVAPGDGTIYAGVKGLPVVGDFAVGVSTKGYLPYTPDKVPDGTKDPEIYGHFYLRGEVEVPEVPVAVKGEFVLDLDANDDGKLLSGDARLTKAVVDLGVEKFGQAFNKGNIAKAVVSGMNDIAIGANVGVAIDFHGLSLNLASTSVWRTPTQLAFRGSTDNPFDGIPYLEAIRTTGGYDIQGFMKTDLATGATSWAFSGYLAAGSVQGLPNVSVLVKGDSASNTFTVTASLTLFDTPIGKAGATLSGGFNTAGDYDLTAKVDCGPLGSYRVNHKGNAKRDNDVVTNIGKDAVTAAYNRVSGAMKDFYKQMAQATSSAAANTTRAVIQAEHDAAEKVAQEVRDAKVKVLEQFHAAETAATTAYHEATQAAQSIANTIADGAKSAWNTFKSWF